MLNINDKKYQKIKVSPGAQLYIDDLEKQTEDLIELLQAANNIIEPAMDILPDTYQEEIDTFLKLKREIDK